jgi:hypothetical protein
MDQVKVILETPDGEGATAMGLVIVPIGPTNGALKKQVAAMKAAQANRIGTALSDGSTGQKIGTGFGLLGSGCTR